MAFFPKKSKALYEAAYKTFQDWQAKNRVQATDEKCLLAYFSQELKDKSRRRSIDISGFMNLKSFLKRKLDGYRPKKSKIYTKEQIFKFLKEAEDSVHLATKVALIIGVYGACRREKIMKLSLDDIEDLKDSIKITIPNTKTKIMRQFIVTKGEAPGVDMLKLFRLYAEKRPAGTGHSRFFVSYRFGKCTKQAMGINTIAKLPRIIAEHLKLPSPELYTGHCFRRSSASLLADSGVDISVLKRHGGWKSSSVAEGYVENSLQQKKSIATKILDEAAEVSEPSEVHIVTSSKNVPERQAESITVNSTLSDTPSTISLPMPSSSSAHKPVQFNNVTNCTINFYQTK
ncbi:conserved hypothetical protein [Culex quinquefasciatus]|uniref:Tyr recombinase domain-containing protein n=1 Tax=Culex quinquefasciatus TaxID=7176 RepID=B0X897_CULQU|nr:conserved hypothetical protein [Culex quinquefasciatus]|eukprot:XP_001865869.1 conserved hypothetical protein [Culex quinquefasciatus]